MPKQKNIGKSVSATAAMNTAMSTLPETSPDSKYTCGIGAGSNSGIYALGIGCSTNINENALIIFMSSSGFHFKQMYLLD